MIAAAQDLLPNAPRFDQLYALHNTGQLIQGAQGVLGADIDDIVPGAGHRLNAALVLNAAAFGPEATLLPPQNIASETNAPLEITVHYADNEGVDGASLGEPDLVVPYLTVRRDRLDSGALQVRLNQIVPGDDGKKLAAMYRIHPPGGRWDGEDVGTYHIELQSGYIADVNGIAVSVPRYVHFGERRFLLIRGRPESVGDVQGNHSLTDSGRPRIAWYETVCSQSVRAGR